MAEAAWDGVSATHRGSGPKWRAIACFGPMFFDNSVASIKWHLNLDALVSAATAVGTRCVVSENP
jgi:hypothetical protein